MQHSVLIIDDEKIIPKYLKKEIEKRISNINVFTASDEDDIIYKVENLYYNIAVVDLKMDDFEFDGIDIIEKILNVNPFANIIVMTGYLPEFRDAVNILKKSGRIIDIIDKLNMKIFTKQIIDASNKIIDEFENNPNINIKALESLFADAVNQ